MYRHLLHLSVLLAVLLLGLRPASAQEKLQTKPTLTEVGFGWESSGAPLLLRRGARGDLSAEGELWQGAGEMSPEYGRWKVLHTRADAPALSPLSGPAAPLTENRKWLLIGGAVLVGVGIVAAVLLSGGSSEEGFPLPPGRPAGE